MRAAYVEELSPEPRVEVGERPEPERGAGETLIAVAAATVAHFELTVLSGEFFPRQPPLPFIAGSEVAGRVLESEAFAPGTLVRVGGAGVGVVRDGGWAERMVAPDAAIDALPDGVDPAIAAAYFSPAGTAHAALNIVGGLRPGDSIAVTGATGAVASLTMQLALRAGAGRVVGFHRDPDKGHLLPEGAESVRWEGAATADRFRGEEGFDVVVDVVGGEITALLATRAIKPGGTLVMVGYAGSDELSASLTELIVADVSLKPVNAINLEGQMRPAANAMLTEIGGELELRTVSLPLDEVNEAIALLLRGTAGGRILLEP